MRLFAILAIGESDSEDGIRSRDIVKDFLDDILNREMVRRYLEIYEEYKAVHQGGSEGRKRKRTSVNSVKLLKICSEINQELTQRQKIVLTIWLLEFIFTDQQATEEELEFVDTVAESFNLENEEYQGLKEFVFAQSLDGLTNDQLLLISDQLAGNVHAARYIRSNGLIGQIAVLRLASVNEYAFRYFGEDTITLNGQVVPSLRTNVLSRGSVIRNNRMNPVYYSDIISSYLSDSDGIRIRFQAKGISYTFPNGNRGLHTLDLNEESGRMVGVMGGSGSGKSTLLNTLNGNYQPTEGMVLLNGYDIHTQSSAIDGQIGYIAQDDLLIEELTVFQNLYYTAKLCFGSLSEEDLVAKVDSTLDDLGLIDKKHLKVGNPLQKTISGGQRKRLNIALELIREPAVLFVDEPTSGLSSRDSENIMDLLKELTLTGRLVFVVIHQPSSEIFKMFDRMLILDQGGYPVFYGNPVESISYFKRLADYAGGEEGSCGTCGHVNPELIFNILEAKMVDEYGIQTAERKVEAEEWYDQFQKEHSHERLELDSPTHLPETAFKRPSVLKQFMVFIKRDLLSKSTNRQYMLINLLEAPALATLLAFFLKFYRTDMAAEDAGYIFRLNENIPVFIFISVIVGLFIGLTVSSEEIIRDKQIRAREAFLSLSRNSYISSKIAIMLGISAIQMALYVIIGSLILEIDGMGMYYWIALFSTCCFANVLGLNISANFNSAKVIYILIPVMIIPQLLFSGIIVSFDKLHPWFASQKSVPWIGNVMTSRWAYEGLAVAQFKKNDYAKEFYALDQHRYYANWKKDHWVKAVENKLVILQRKMDKELPREEWAPELDIIHAELQKETALIQGLEFEHLHRLNIMDANAALIDETQLFLEQLKKHYRSVFNRAEITKEEKIEEMTKDSVSMAEFKSLTDDKSNEQLEKFLTNRNGLKSIIEYEGEFVMKKDVIYGLPNQDGFFKAPFYAPVKVLFDRIFETFWANILVIWGFTALLSFTLYNDSFQRLAGLWSRLRWKISNKG